MRARLLGTGARRGLPVWIALALAVVLPLWTLAGGGVESGGPELISLSGIDPGSVFRRGLWGGLALFLLVVALMRSARAGELFATRDRAWLAPRLGSPGRAAVELELGLGLGIALALLGLAIGVEIAAPTAEGASAEAFGLERNLPGPDMVVLRAEPEAARTASWLVEDSQGRLSVRPGEATPRLAFVPRALAGEGPSALFRVVVTRVPRRAPGVAPSDPGDAAPNEAPTTVTMRVRNATRVVVPVPEGEGDLRIKVSHGGEGPPLRLSGKRSLVLVPRISLRWTSVVLWQQAVLWIAGAAGLAMGLGARIGTGLGALLTLAIQLASLGMGAGDWLGTGPWLEALATTGDGLVPRGVDARLVVGCGVQLALGALMLRGAIGPRNGTSAR